MTYAIPIVQSKELERRQLNEILAAIEGLQTFYGNPLPSQPQPAGRIAVDSSTGIAYSSSGSAWIAIKATGVWG